MGRICRSWLHREQSEDRLLSVHPRSSHLAAPRDHVMNPLIVVGDVAHEDGLVMRDPVPQAPNDLEVCIGRGPALRGRLTLRRAGKAGAEVRIPRSEEHTSELQSLMRISYAVFCLTKK